MSVEKIQLPQIDIRAQAQFVPMESNPEANYYFFSYRIQIQNKGSFPLQLMSRHWLITDGFGNVEEIRGAGVVGQQPQIHPGQKFEYESSCPLMTTSGSMRGYYEMRSQSGEKFTVEIPEFYLVSPSALH